MTFDTTIHLSDVLTTIIVPMLGYGAVKLYQAITSFVDHTDDTADMVDTHTDIFTEHGMIKGQPLGPVGPTKRRQRTHRSIIVIAFLLLPVWASAQDVIPTLQELRPLYPTPMSKPQISELLNKAAAAHPGWMMLRKEGGNNCPTNDPAKHISCDWLVNSQTQWGYDVLRDQEGVGAVGVTNSAAIAPGTELVMPWDVSPTQPPPPVVIPPQPPPPIQVLNLQPALERIAEMESEVNHRFDQTDKKIDDLREEAKSGLRDLGMFVLKYIAPAALGGTAGWMIAK